MQAAMLPLGHLEHRRHHWSSDSSPGCCGVRASGLWASNHLGGREDFGKLKEEILRERI